MKDFFESLPKVVGSLSILALVVSIFHELGFYYVVGFEFERFMSISDYFSNAVTWLPQSIYFALVGAIITLILWRHRWNFAWDFPNEKLPPLSWSERVYAIIYWPTLAIAAFGTFFGPPKLFVSTYDAIVWVVIFLWLWTWGHLVNRIYAIGALPKTAKLFLLFGPMFVTLSYFAGVHEAYVAFFEKPDLYVVAQSTNEKRNLILLRGLERGLLVRDPKNHETSFLKWANIRVVTRTHGGPRNHTLFCELTGFTCQYSFKNTEAN